MRKIECMALARMMKSKTCLLETSLPSSPTQGIEQEHINADIETKRMAGNSFLSPVGDERNKRVAIPKRSRTRPRIMIVRTDKLIVEWPWIMVATTMLFAIPTFKDHTRLALHREKKRFRVFDWNSFDESVELIVFFNIQCSITANIQRLTINPSWK